MKLYKVKTCHGDEKSEYLFANKSKASAAFDAEVNTLLCRRELRRGQYDVEFWFSVTLEVYEESFEGYFVKTHTLRHYEP